MRLSFIAASLGTLVACQEADLPAPRTESAPIVNGQTETGYPQVGALTARYGNQYGGSFCTGTLITESWVITAAHCVEDVSASQTRFYVGPDARGVGRAYSAPTNGTFYSVDQLIPHPEYNGRDDGYDIALVHLTQPATGVGVFPFNSANLNPYEGDSGFYVGYGATEGINESGAGLKRSTSFPITQVNTLDFYSDYNGYGTCFGDSGGPTLLTVNGELRVVGVTSAGEACSGPNCDPCKTATISTRVDAYTAWINQQLGAPPPDCNDNPGTCSCDEACQANGQCNNTLCPLTGTCQDGVDCWFACETEDCSACADGLTPAENAKYQPLETCLDDCYLGSETQQQFSTCVDANCADEYNVCFPPVVGNDTCAEVYGCLVGCQSDACAQACYEAGTSAAQGQFDELYGCFDDNDCLGETTDTGFQQCVSANCASEANTCLGTTIDPPCTDNDDDGTCVEDDCNDNNPSIEPGRSETCDNGQDDDCDGSTDEGCGGEPTSPTEPTDNPDPDPDQGDTTNTTGNTTGTSGGDTSGNQAVGSKSSGCSTGAEAPLVLALAGLGLVVLRRRRTLGV